MYVTKRYRLKNPPKHLDTMAKSVNFVWNYCNEWSYKSIVNNSTFLSAFDLQKLTSGCSKELGIGSDSIQLICEQYVINRNTLKRRKLKWRSDKSLSWIPFRGGKYIGSGVFKCWKRVYYFWESRFVGSIKRGSFCKDSKGRWYINFVVDDTCVRYKKSGESIGVDLGLKRTATYSDGSYFDGVRPTRVFEEKLRLLQKAKKKNRVSAIHTKIRNIRKDSIHKETTRLVKNYDLVIVGDVSPTKICRTKMAKSAFDVSWGAYKSMLAYKTIRFGKELKVVKEAWTSKTCHICNYVADFGGLSGLSVREWTCTNCGKTHDRDVNAARNILRIGHDTPIKGAIVYN